MIYMVFIDTHLCNCDIIILTVSKASRNFKRRLLSAKFDLNMSRYLYNFSISMNILEQTNI